MVNLIFHYSVCVIISTRADSGEELTTVSTEMFCSPLLLLVIKLKNALSHWKSRVAKDSMTAHSSQEETLAGGVPNVRGVQKHRLHRKLQDR